MAEATFRAVWPILDAEAPVSQLLAEARSDLHALAMRAHASLTGEPRFSIAPSASVPGSGRVSTNVLVATVPAVPATPRPYRMAVPW